MVLMEVRGGCEVDIMVGGWVGVGRVCWWGDRLVGGMGVVFVVVMILLLIGFGCVMLKVLVF